MSDFLTFTLPCDVLLDVGSKIFFGQVSQSVMGKLNIQRFDISKLKADRAILAIGKKGSGKSVLINDLAYRIRSMCDLGVAMSPSWSSQEMFREFLPPSQVHAEFQQDMIEKLVAFNRGLQSDGKRVRKVALFLDDMGFDTGLFRLKVTRDLLMNGRHVGIFLLFSLQFVLGVPPDIRGNVDYVFVFMEKIRKNRTKLYENFFGVFDKFADFEKAFQECTNNYECLVLDNTVASNRLEDCVFWYKADPTLPKFQFGTPLYHMLYRKFRTRRKKTEVVQSGPTNLAALVEGTTAGQKRTIDEIEKQDEHGNKIVNVVKPGKRVATMVVSVES